MGVVDRGDPVAVLPPDEPRAGRQREARDPRGPSLPGDLRRGPGRAEHAGYLDGVAEHDRADLTYPRRFHPGRQRGHRKGADDVVAVVEDGRRDAAHLLLVLPVVDGVTTSSDPA